MDFGIEVRDVWCYEDLPEIDEVSAGHGLHVYSGRVKVVGESGRGVWKEGVGSTDVEALNQAGGGCL